MTNFVLAVYEIDRAYGGPEEGGWWYDVGVLKRVIGVRKSEDEAYALARRLNGWLARMQRGLRPVSSVAYGGGRYAVEVFEDIPPRAYPETRPHYE